MSAGRPCGPRVCWGNAASHGQCVHACGSLCFDAGCRCQGVVDPSVVHCAFVLQLQMLGYPIGFVAFPVIEVMTQVSEGTVQTNYWGPVFSWRLDFLHRFRVGNGSADKPPCTRVCPLPAARNDTCTSASGTCARHSASRPRRTSSCCARSCSRRWAPAVASPPSPLLGLCSCDADGDGLSYIYSLLFDRCVHHAWAVPPYSRLVSTVPLDVTICGVSPFA